MAILPEFTAMTPHHPADYFAAAKATTAAALRNWSVVDAGAP